MAASGNSTEPNSRQRQHTLRKWQNKFVEGTDFDNWGQPVEADGCYQSLTGVLAEELQARSLQFSESDEVILRKILYAVEKRHQFLQSGDTTTDALDVTEMKAIAEAFNNWTEGAPLPQVGRITLPKSPIEAGLKARLQSKIAENNDGDDDDDEDGEAFPLGEVGGSSLVPKPVLAPGKTLLTIWIEKIGLKDATHHINPFFAVSVKDTFGTDFATAQTTPLATGRSDLYLNFKQEVFLDIAVEDIPDDCAIFFELRHYKQKKNKMSTRCFSFLEKDEIKEGQSNLELYRKPTNFKRRKVNLLTVKPLYLYLNLTLTRR